MIPNVHLMTTATTATFTTKASQAYAGGGRTRGKASILHARHCTPLPRSPAPAEKWPAAMVLAQCTRYVALPQAGGAALRAHRGARVTRPAAPRAAQRVPLPGDASAAACSKEPAKRTHPAKQVTQNSLKGPSCRYCVGPACLSSPGRPHTPAWSCRHTGGDERARRGDRWPQLRARRHLRRLPRR